MMFSFLTSAGFIPSFLAVWTHVYDVAHEFVFQRPTPLGVQLAQTGNTTDPSTQLNLTAFFDVKAAASSPSDTSANFDGYGRSYPSKLLPSSSNYSFRGLEFTLPPFHSPSNDALRSAGQVLNLSTADSRQYHSMHILGAVTFAPGASAVPSVANVTFHYADGGTYDATVILAPWFSPGAVFEGAIYLPYHYANPSLDSNQTIDKNNTHIHYATARIPSARNLTALTLPPSRSNIHIFAITLVQASVPDNIETASGPALWIQNVRSTTKWIDNSTESSADGNAGAQLIEVTVANLAPLNASDSAWISTNYSVVLESDTLTTAVPASVQRLAPNDQVVLLVGVRNADGVVQGSNATVRVVIMDAGGQDVGLVGGEKEWVVTAGIPVYDDSDESLGKHEAPEWYNDAKFGLFIHWGIYSVPAWAPTGRQYAAWYNWDFHNPFNSPTAKHHLALYGPNVTYDDFIANFTAQGWDPNYWLDLIADAGAKYFVFVTKHHDGFSLFETGNSSDRNSLLLGPKRDITKDLIESAKTRYPDLRRGLYYSLPEWFNPDYGPYGHQSFPGMPALNAFNGSCCDPYIGWVHKENFLTDVQKPQMKSLFYDYGAEILWCDIGYASAYPEIAAEWYNAAAAQGRQVVRDDRCGSSQTDFSTPEYASYDAVLSSKWETSEGIDPYAYAYNSDTPPEAYKNASILIPRLVDIVSKGGNYLLGFGPMANGTVIPAMTKPLHDIGQWLSHSGPAIFGTRTWWVQPSDPVANLRFTSAPDAFYVIALSRPEGSVRTRAPVPARAGDRVTMLGGSGAILEWKFDGDEFVIEFGDEAKWVDFAWAFRVEYAGVDTKDHYFIT